VSDRRTASKARLRAGIRCFKFYGCDVGVPAVLEALRFDCEDTCAGLTEMFAHLVAEHKRLLESEGDMSLHAPLKFANIQAGDLDEKD
jgi:hypothetical protein